MKKTINKDNKLKFHKKWLTLIELIIATFVWFILMWACFVFLNDITYQIATTKEKTGTYSSFYDFSRKIDNYKNVYIHWEILVNSGSNNDVFLLKDSSWINGVLLSTVDYDTKKINIDNVVYNNKVLGFRLLSQEEIVKIELDRSEIYNLEFHNDLLFQNLKVIDFQIEKYNIPEIFEINLKLKQINNNIWYGEMKKTIKKEEILSNNLYF